MKRVFLAAICVLIFEAAAAANEIVLDRDMHHLRIEGPREWAGFPEAPEAAGMELRFSASSNPTAQTLRLRQQDVKQTWHVTLNGNELGTLRPDENDMVVYFEVPAGALRDGTNVLRVEQDTTRLTPDDVRLGEVVIDARAMSDALSEATVEVEVTDADSKEHLPARLTIVNEDGALQTPGARSSDFLAVRPGFVLTSTGKARFGLPAGSYTIYAGRGFEYSLAQAGIHIAAGEAKQLALSIRREVPTQGYVSSDTHLHTFTHSGHGDATTEERIITIAAEGLELPIATDHNLAIDYNPAARGLRVGRYFTPVTGSEVTTPTAHFNVFPIAPGAPVPDHRSRDWAATLGRIYATPGVKVAILNHPRDVHSGTRPFDPALFNEAAGANLDGWHMGFNAMEVVNSGAIQSDPLELLRDWMTLLNHGLRVTPVGSSDSHDVMRFFPGQGRTYIRCDDRDVSSLDLEEAVANFVQGRVMVSYGLLAEITVNGKYGPGEIAAAPGDKVHVAVRVLGPHWVSADRIVLYANGKPIREEAIDSPKRDRLPRGVLWEGEWSIPKPGHDVFLNAVATGPGVDGWYWRTAKPYQPASPRFEARVIGASGAVWLDADANGRPRAAYDYARHLVDAAGGDFPALMKSLAGYDEAVAAQAAYVLQESGVSPGSGSVQAALSNAAAATRSGFAGYLRAQRESEAARAAR